MIDVTTSDGKYRYVQQADGKVIIYRNGEVWVEQSGLGMVNTKGLIESLARDLQAERERADWAESRISS